MPIFIYTARDIHGKQVKGEFNSYSQQHVITELRKKKLFPVKIVEKPERSKKPANDIDIFKPRVTKKHIAIFTRQFASMLKSGMPLTVILEVMINQEKNKTFKIILESINADIMKGYTLSLAMSKFKEFSPLLLSMVKVGEANGRLDLSLARYSSTLEKEIKIVSKIKGAMIYPTVLLTVTILVSILLTFIVLPFFTKMFDQMGGKLPPLTAALINYSTFMKSYWYIPVGCIALLVLLIYKILKEPSSRKRVDEMLLKLPIIGRLLSIILMARFCRTFSSLLEGGVGIIESLAIVKNVISNLHVKYSFDQIIEDVKVGSPLSQSVVKHELFTPLVVSTIRIGEESGSLGEALSRTAELYEEDSEIQMQRVAALAEPMVTVIMAIGIGLLVISIVQPMFKMYTLIGQP